MFRLAGLNSAATSACALARRAWRLESRALDRAGHRNTRRGVGPCLSASQGRRHLERGLLVPPRWADRVYRLPACGVDCPGCPSHQDPRGESAEGPARNLTNVTASLGMIAGV